MRRANADAVLDTNAEFVDVGADATDGLPGFSRGDFGGCGGDNVERREARGNRRGDVGAANGFRDRRDFDRPVGIVGGETVAFRENGSGVFGGDHGGIGDATLGLGACRGDGKSPAVIFAVVAAMIGYIGVGVEIADDFESCGTEIFDAFAVDHVLRINAIRKVDVGARGVGDRIDADVFRDTDSD